MGRGQRAVKRLFASPEKYSRNFPLRNGTRARFLPSTFRMAGFRLFDLNEAQREAVTTTDGPLLILAGAGTGKTRVITARAAYLIAQGADPASVLAVTFTNKAAKEMRERLASMIEKSEAKKVTMATFHALCVRLLRSGIDRLGYKNNFTIYDESDQMGLLRKIINQTAARDEKLEPNLAKNLISKAKNNHWSAPADEQTLIGAVYARYQTALKNLNAVDFDDLLVLCVQLLDGHPDVRAKWQARFRYLMVDEFQDTNKLQLQLVTLLSGPERNVCVVGDDDQSIYGWRGAEVSNILEFEHHFPNPKVVKLEENYRSTNPILAAANAVIKNNPRRRPKHLRSNIAGDEKVRLIQMPDDRQEAQFIAEEIHRRQMQTGEAFENFAVLFRMNAQSRLLEGNLRELKIPYRVIGGKSFFDRREVKDVIAYATALLNPDDDISLLRIINTPARGISAMTTERALELSVQRRCSLFAALQLPEFAESLPAKARESIRAFARLLTDYEAKLHTPLADAAAVWSALIEEVGYLADMKRSCKVADDALKRESNVRDLIETLRQRAQPEAAQRVWSSLDAKSGAESLRGFLDDLALKNEREDEDDDKGSGVTLITLHAAKGLEFPHVYLIGLEEGLLPHDRSKMEGTVDEERRLLYVGITRAMRTLALTHCSTRIKFGSAAACSPSSFIKELPDEHLERLDLATILSKPVEATDAKAWFAKMRAAIGAPS